MPRIGEFYGVIIARYFNDHLPAHLHAYQGEHAALIVTDTLDTYAGSLPRRALALVLEWGWSEECSTGQSSGPNWELARRGEPLTRVQPLD